MKAAILLLLTATVASASPCREASGRRWSYAYRSGGQNVTIAGGASIEDFRRLRSSLGSDGFWVRIEGVNYVVHDEDFVGRVQAFFAPVRALEPDVQAVEREQEELDQEIDAIEDDEDRDAAGSARLKELHTKMKDVTRREKKLDEETDRLSCDAEAKTWTLVNEAIRSGLAKRVR